MAKFFIERPAFAMALSLIICLIGGIAAFNLPIAQYPNIVKPRTTVETTYVGANAAVVEDSIAQAIEQKVMGVENMRDMRSTSTNAGGYSLNVQFNLDKDPNIAAVEVQNRVAQANAAMPQEVLNYGITTVKRAGRSDIWLSLNSPNGTYDAVFLRAYGMSNIVDPIKRVKGFSAITEFAPEYAMRVELRPDKMATFGLTAADVTKAIAQQNIQAPVGAIGNQPTELDQELNYSANSQGRLRSVEEFENIVVKSERGRLLTVKDIAFVREGIRREDRTAEYDGRPAVAYAIYLTTDANIIESIDEIKKVVAAIQHRLPPDMKLVVSMDRSIFVKESLNKVARTFFEALLLVLLVVYLFLGDWRATLIPMLAVPVSLIGTFAAFLLLGITLNTVSLFALILAIGLVVDDAIVVVEAVEHHIQDNHLPPKEATIRAMDEVSGPVVAIACVLAAVFLPISFVSGSTGMLYRQFSLTVSVSMMLSALIALSLTPALCAVILKPHGDGRKPSRFAFIDNLVAKFNAWFARTLGRYVAAVDKCLKHARAVLAAFLVMLLLTGLAAHVTPSGYVPDEDQGMLLVCYNLPEGASHLRVTQQTHILSEKIRALPGVEHVVSVNGYDQLVGAAKSSAGHMQVILYDFPERDATAADVIANIRKIARETPEMVIRVFNPAALPGLSSTGSLTLYVMNLAGDDLATMDGYAREFVARAQQRPEIGTAYTTFNTDTPAYTFKVDRRKAQSLDVPIADVYAALKTFLGGSEVNDFNNFGRIWKVVVQAQPQFRNDVKNLRLFYVRSNSGKMIPLDALVEPEFSLTVPSITRFNGASAFKIAGAPAPGYSTGQAMIALGEVAAEVLPPTYTYEWVDQSRDEQEASSNTFFLYTVSLIFIFLCLVALYESWTIPLAVLLSVPPAILGCFGSQLLRGEQNNIYMQVALITLIGLAAKNAILIVEYAKINMENGESVIDAIRDACRLRLRPILMTSFAFILGCIPLAIASGAGAGARVAMGNAVVGGMTFATFAGIFLIPVMFIAVMYVFNKKARAEIKDHAAG